MTATKNIHGMTLIELMIVVAILAIISAIAIPAYNGYIQTARIQECQQEIASLVLAEEEFFLESRTYFMGSGVVAIEGASGNLWKASETVNNKRNCTYEIAVGSTTSITTSYKITATGKNKLPLTFTITKGN